MSNAQHDKSATTSKYIALGSLVVSVFALYVTCKQHAETTQLTKDMDERDQQFSLFLQRREQQFTVWLEEQNRQLDQPSLEANSNFFFPDLGRPGMTRVPVFNPGTQEALIVKMEFEIIHSFPTPHEPFKAGAAEHYRLWFRYGDYNQASRRFSAPFRRTVGVAGGKNAVFYVAIVEPRWAGTSYVGNLIVHYDRGDPLTVSNLQLDVLTKEPVAADFAQPVR